MNTQEKIIALLLGLALAGWLWYSVSEQKKSAEAAAREPRSVEVADGTEAVAPKAPVPPKAPEAAEGGPRSGAATDGTAPVPPKQTTPEQLVTLANSQIAVELSSHGAVVKRATLKEYGEKPGKLNEENPAVTLDFSAAPALSLDGVPELPSGSDFTIAEKGEDFVLFKSVAQIDGRPLLSRRVALKDDYRLAVEDDWAPKADGKGDAVRLSVGSMSLGASKNDILSIDSWIVSDAKGKSRVEHHGETDPLKSYLAASSGGCSGSQSAEGMPVESIVDVPGARSWLAVKNRFFVAALAKLPANNGFRAVAVRDGSAKTYLLKSVSAAAAFARPADKMAYLLYIGPKKQSLLWELGMKDVMEFGMWRWVCYPMVWVLNLFHSWVPSYGIAIILLTILVRLVFWPLTHKSTISMRRMSEIQPKIKEIQKKFKDNPQRLQQETFACYRENKVNPMASCLPMLVQIPVFIALFTVLRSAVELRYAPFLWIADLSEPEALGANSWFPWFGGLNILPILMAATMALQSALTPSTGDKSQQRMMMIMMPAMMLFMFYSFPSALSLYWTLSQVFSIAQMWWIRKKYTPPAATGGAIDPDSIEMPITRQMRRHS